MINLKETTIWSRQLIFRTSTKKLCFLIDSGSPITSKVINIRIMRWNYIRNAWMPVYQIGERESGSYLDLASIKLVPKINLPKQRVFCKDYND